MPRRNFKSRPHLPVVYLQLLFPRYYADKTFKVKTTTAGSKVTQKQIKVTQRQCTPTLSNLCAYLSINFQCPASPHCHSDHPLTHLDIMDKIPTDGVEGNKGTEKLCSSMTEDTSCDNDEAQP